jgi:hypothetical protein
LPKPKCGVMLRATKEPTKKATCMFKSSSSGQASSTVQPRRTLFVLVAALVIAALFSTVIVKKLNMKLAYQPVPDVVKEDCQRLVAGKLVFAPSATMRQGQSQVVFARLSRGADTKILGGLDGSKVVIENAQVSCLVSMKLDSQEEGAFKIVKIPAGRTDEQILLPDKYSQWDWRVTPLKSGVLHLLLYVTPMLYVNGVGKGLKQFPQEPRIITVSPDRVYAVWGLLVAHWAIWSVLLTVIVVPFLVWGFPKIKAWWEKRKKGRMGF